ncbi:protein HtrL-like isoform X2 [Biomphalaria glabrata]|nr:protein HtrL-like isoform X2 [Biomphalaria glabrata]XP_055891018.1 protein HtrL-like isoform X2 [Biomphalaria glabrata]XP_055891019.1 protein HtrL-like isoform X2 [Biomphalaria glabrata]XP_055891020.1 protein HtrL-like isoform X2 [Biomphalaria glabrata]XP_055891022.1 protein HtrL-like isoform X2 [Biomphalaria glabrata]
MWLNKLNRSKVITRLILLISGLLLTIFGLVHWVTSYQEWIKVIQDSQMAMEWEGFGPERGLYNFTVVTAMLDIGRGSWQQQSRKYNQYLLYMQRVLRLDVNVVVYVDEKGKPFIEWMRRGREKHTSIVVTSLTELPYYRHKDRITEIMNSPAYQQDNELVINKLCESYIPEYDILQLSKLHFINRTVWENPFSTTYFLWLDGGYSHGQDVFPQNNIWIPKDLFEHATQVTFMERAPGVKVFQKDRDRLHKMSINVLAGNFFAGGSEALKELCEMQRQLVDEWMTLGIVDDDQTMYMWMYYKKPSLFHLVSADWEDVFKLFNKNSDLS